MSGSGATCAYTTARRCAPKLRSITTFTLEPKAPFTLASAARFVAGWPPGRAHSGDEELRLHFLVDDWSGPARVVLTQEGGTGHAQAVKLRDALGETFPPPEHLLALQELKGLPANKIPRLHGIAQAALEGKLDREPRLEQAVQTRYGRSIGEVAEHWRPFRTWISVLMRANA